MNDLMTLEQARRIYPCGEREEIIDLFGTIVLVEDPDPAIADADEAYQSVPVPFDFTGKGIDKDRLLEILMEAWEREAAERDAAQAEARALREKVAQLASEWDAESSRIYMNHTPVSDREISRAHELQWCASALRVTLAPAEAAQ